MDQKKAAPLSRPDRSALLERPAGELPLATQAALLGLNRPHLYYVPVPPSAEELLLKRQIDEIFTARPCSGVRKITAQLRKAGWLVTPKAVARHLREMGLAAISPGPHRSQRAHAHAVYPYLLRSVPAQRPNQVWGIDSPYIRWQQGWMSRVAGRDWYSRSGVSWALDQTLQAGW